MKVLITVITINLLMLFAAHTAQAEVVTLKGFYIGMDKKEVLFQRLNCNIPPGGIVVINGYNSAGKSTLCKAILGLVSPLKGSILYDWMG